MKRNMRWTILLLVVLPWFPNAQTPGIAVAAEKQYLPEPSFVGALKSRFEIGRLTERIEDAGKEPLYCRIELAQYVIGLLTDRTLLETPNYIYQPGSHDMRLCAARAAKTLETIIGKKFPPIDKNTTGEELNRLVEETRTYLVAYQAGVCAAMAAKEGTPDVAKLREKYRSGLQHRNGKDHSKGIGQMAALLKEWFPIGKSAADLTEICGDPDRQRDIYLYYRFDGGFGGLSFVFEIEDGRIAAVHVLGID